MDSSRPKYSVLIPLYNENIIFVSKFKKSFTIKLFTPVPNFSISLVETIYLYFQFEIHFQIDGIKWALLFTVLLQTSIGYALLITDWALKLRFVTAEKAIGL